MGENSKIEWTHHTFNPWRGCTKVSEGCANCYAERESKRNPLILGVWGNNGHRMAASPAKWAELLKLDRIASDMGERHKVFCASFADVFEDWPGHMSYPANEDGEMFPGCMWHRDDIGIVNAGGTTTGHVRGERTATMQDVRLKLFAYIAKCKHLDFQLLTKRPRMMRQFFETRDIHNQVELATDRYFPRGGDPSFGGKHRLPQFPWPNVWLGVSVENQAAADERIPELLRIPAAVRFLSCEPLLGPLSIRHLLIHDASAAVCRCGHGHGFTRCPNYGGIAKTCHRCACSEFQRVNGIRWVIAGGESGPNARPCHPDWVRSLRDQCQAAGVPFFFKQWGEWLPFELGSIPEAPAKTPVCLVKADGQVIRPYRGYDAPGYEMARVGKKAAGRQLDGREWSEFPAART